MQHTIAAVFDNQNKVQQAKNDLLNSGFSPDEVHLSQSDNDTTHYENNTIHRTDDDESFGSGIKNFFRNMFGSDSDDDADIYSSAVMHGKYVLTVNLQNDEDVERATEVLDRYDPIDIDEHAAEWHSGSAETDTTGFDMGAKMADRNATEMRSDNMTTNENLNEKAIPVIQEELKVGKRVVQRGGVRVFQHMTETPVTKNVNLREEHVSVERRPVNQPIDASTDLNAFKEGTYELRETAEEAVVEKTARVVEEVIVGKKSSQREEVINDTLRSANVEIEQLGGGSGMAGMGADDYRTHWNSNYANAGSYEDYAPAYQYGSTMSSDSRYKNANWDDIEPNVRSDWESKNPGSTWEKMKGAVRHGWEKMTS